MRRIRRNCATADTPSLKTPPPLLSYQPVFRRIRRIRRFRSVFRPSSDLCQCLFQVVDYILWVFDANGEAYQFRRQASRPLLLL